jgi:hypothetical protein
MNPSTQYDSSNNANARACEDTLRLLATLPVPGGLEDRIKSRLKSAPGSGRVLLWPASFASGANSAVRAAAAAAIVFVVAGGGWGVYSHVKPAMESRVIVMPRQGDGSRDAGSFSSAGAMRTPQTLNGPVLTHPEAGGQIKSDEKSSEQAATKKSPRARKPLPKKPIVESAIR